MHFRRLLAGLVLALCAVGAYTGVARADGPVPTLASDRATYAPGDAAQLTSTGWLPGAPVHVHVADSDGYGWSFDDDLTASADGSTSSSVALPSGFESDFVAVATSGLGGSATAAFSSSSVPASTPTIVSDQNDYAPGSTVTLTGTDWLPNELVHLVVNDQDGQTWSYNADLSSDSSGAFTHQFQLPNWFVANYTVVATGFSGSSATTSFTDAIQTTTTIASSVNPSALGQSVTFTATVTCSSPCTFGSQTVDFVEGANQNCNGGTTLGSTGTLTGSGLSRQATFTTSSLTGGTHAIRACFNGGGPGTTPGSSTSSALSQVVNACTAPSVTTQPTSLSITYGQNASLTAAANGTSPSVQWQVDSGSGFANLPGATSTTLALTKPPVSASGNQYRAIFSNACGTATSNAATLTVGAKNLTIAGAVANNKIYDSTAGATVDFTAATLKWGRGR
jgi:hypothetical protein